MITVDTNILLRHLLQDDPEKAAACRRLLYNASGSGDELYVPITVLSELSWFLTRQRGFTRQEVATGLLNLISIPGVIVDNREAVEAALHYWLETGGVSFIDCYHLSITSHLGMRQIYAYDQKMGRYPGVERIEP